jgi:hypothetical protein
LVNVTMYHTHTTIIEKKFSLAWYWCGLLISI